MCERTAHPSEANVNQETLATRRRTVIHTSAHVSSIADLLIGRCSIKIDFWLENEERRDMTSSNKQIDRTRCAQAERQAERERERISSATTLVSGNEANRQRLFIDIEKKLS